jgi:Common central domain of tyrosinase/Polyphenol oxidase middle domain
VKTTRRSFFQQIAAFGMVFWIETSGYGMMQDQCTLPPFDNAVQLVPNEPKVVDRISTIQMSETGKANQLKKLREAFCKIQQLSKTNPNDLIGWDKQIAQHCLHCKGPRGPASNNIHYSSAFLPWHRAYLYFMERILRNLGGDNDLRLVYWNWESPSSYKLPAIYAPNTPGQCLYYGNRGAMTTGSLTPAQVDVKALLAIPDFPTFGGGTQGNPGAVYGGPHANVHNAFAPGDMANLMYSPRDPVFYAHHGNIDRLWSSWVKAGHPNPDFGTDKAYFYDENRKLRYILFNDLRDETKLGYRYSSYMSPRVLAAHLEQFNALSSEAHVPFEDRAIAKMRTATQKVLIIRNIQNLDKLGDTRTFGIFADTPAPGTQSTADPAFLGTVATIRSDETHEETGPLTAALDVSAKLPRLTANKKNALDLTVAALDAHGKTTGQSIPLSAASISLIE